MRNKLSDLNNTLFEEMERLMDDSLTDEQFEKEKARARLVTNVAGAIVNNARLQLDAVKHMDEYGKGHYAKMPALLAGSADEGESGDE